MMENTQISEWRTLSLKLTITAFLFVGFSGCKDVAIESDTEVVDRWLCRARDGGDGGRGGEVTVIYGNTTNDLETDPFLELSGGLGGVGGNAEVGEPGEDGSPGKEGEIDIILERDFVFDEVVEPGFDVFISVQGQEDTISLVNTADPKVIIVDRFHIGPEGELTISCDTQIIARSFLIESGGTLKIQSREGMSCAIGVGGSNAEQNGIFGPMVYIEAETFQLAGTVDISGNDGGKNQDGGDGGHIIVRAESVSFEEAGRIVGVGGNGGEGDFEEACP